MNTRRKPLAFYDLSSRVLPTASDIMAPSSTYALRYEILRMEEFRDRYIWDIGSYYLPSLG